MCDYGMHTIVFRGIFDFILTWKNDLYQYILVYIVVLLFIYAAKRKIVL